MNYFFDSEFLEDGVTIEPISLGICSEDGREFYVEFKFDQIRVNQCEFLRTNVVPHLKGDVGLTREEAAQKLIEFVGDDENPKFWAWYASYDWILLCQLFGRMIDLPRKFPKFVRDLKQICDQFEISRDKLPPDPPDSHNALVDARWLKLAYSYAKSYIEDRWYPARLD